MARKKVVKTKAGPTGAELWAAVMDGYELDEVPQKILASACECADRACAAKKEVLKYGVMIESATGTLHLNPSIRAENDARKLMLAHLRQLELDLEPLNDRPGRPAGR